MSTFRVGVLDQSPIPEGSNGVAALANTLDLAQHCELLGYQRYWIAEHHATPMLAGAAPEVLIAAVASRTQRMRVGSGGVMLPHYSPFKVAESFSMLSGLYPDRIDLGLGRASGTDPMTTLALQRDRRHTSPDDFPHQLAELLAYLDGTLPQDHPFARLSATLPGLPERPVPWLLGSSPQSGLWASELGLPYAFADFINPDGGYVARRYRDEFQPSATNAEPRVMVCTWVICADTDDEARRLAASSDMAMRMLFRGQLIPVPPVETALEFLAAQQEAPQSSLPVSRPRRRIVGSVDTVRAKIDALMEEYGADELMVVTITFEHAARRRSYELLARALNL